MDRREFFFPKAGKARISKVFPCVLCVDPGLEGTGWAVFESLRPNGTPLSKPVKTGVIRPEKSGSWQTKANIVCCTFAGIVASLRTGGFDPPVIIMEFPELWSTGKSFASASGAQGDLFKLAYLVGGMSRTAHELSLFQPLLISPGDWKGQLPKDVVIDRIGKVLRGAKPPRDHEADAIGIGLACQGLI